jgi:hypothetical protein
MYSILYFISARNKENTLDREGLYLLYTKYSTKLNSNGVRT